MIRTNVRAMSGYVPGEQPRDDGVLKLNTNENPYPPSPAVFAAIRAVLTGDRLRKYPDPLGTEFREAAGEFHGVSPDAILIGNGSDDILTILTRAFVPEGGLIVAPSPTYLLYRTLAEIQGARFQTVPFTADWKLPAPRPVADANLTFVANPNSPSATCISTEELERFAHRVPGPLAIDEAYAVFADTDAIGLIRRPNVIVTRTLSKAYSLAGIRFGYAIADPAVIRELVKVKDSYNCDALSLVAATAAIRDKDYLAETRAKILVTRNRLECGLAGLGFAVTPSQANFVWCQHPNRDAASIYEALKARKILIRYMDYPDFGAGLRITVGTDAEIDLLLVALSAII